MRLGIMQPYFFPYLGHFALISSINEWVVFDVTQYTPKSWMNRNRILHPESGWNYISLPLERSSISLKSKDVKIKNIIQAERSILGKLSHYKKQAPFYDEVTNIVKGAFLMCNSDLLVDLNLSILIEVCRYLNIPFNYKKCSELGIDFPNNMKAGDWAPYICNHLNTTEYVNPIDGIKLFNINDFHQINVELSSCLFTSFYYETGRYQFESNLSILDVLMWNSPFEINQAIDKNTKINKTIST